MNDPYLYEGSSVLRNLLNIHDEKELDIAEAELSQANMMMLYEQGFDDFSTQGIKTIHKVLFEDVYDWAGEFRTINIQKREPLLAGISVWYTDSDNIKKDLDSAWKAIKKVKWKDLSREEFAVQNIGITHEKVLICDKKFVVVGSFNWLSFKGDKQRGLRLEKSVYTEELSVIEDALKDIQSYENVDKHMFE